VTAPLDLNESRRVHQRISPPLTKTGQGPCCHVELRFTRAEACRRAGLDLNHLLDGPDVSWLLDSQARIAPIDRKKLDRAIERKARRCLPSTQRRHPKITVGKLKTKIRTRAADGNGGEDCPHTRGVGLDAGIISVVILARAQMLIALARNLRRASEHAPVARLAISPSGGRRRYLISRAEGTDRRRRSDCNFMNGGVTVDTLFRPHRIRVRIEEPSFGQAFPQRRRCCERTQAAFLTVSEAAALLRISTVTSSRWRIAGQRPGFRKRGRRVMHAREELMGCSKTERCQSAFAANPQKSGANPSTHTHSSGGRSG
jgi:hypothetical protein